jgi:radical SAM superfamily enzyme YgiQ (UPF0313 family)
MKRHRRKKILLLQPPLRDFYRTRFREYPLGLLYLASSLIEAGHEVKIIDARLCKKPKPVNIYPELVCAEKLHLFSGMFAGFRHFGMKFDAIAEAAKEFAPDIVCLNSMFTPYEREVFATAQSIKAALPSCKIVAGGCHATASPETHLDSGYIDCVIKGEGEKALLQIVAMDNPHGIISADGRPFIENDLDALPVPARSLIDASKYTLGKKRYTMILTTRGCPHRCSFCSTHVVAGFIHRTRSADSVMHEIDECVRNHGIGIIDFQDDNFLYDRPRAVKILSEVSAKYAGTVEFMATNGLNAAHLDGEIITLLKKCGFRKLDLALATGEVESRCSMLRPETVAKYESTLKAANQIGLPVTTYIILGFPKQSLCEIKDTVRYLKGLETLIAPSVFYNVPGMPIFEEMKKYEYSNSNTARRSSAINCYGDDFDRNDILEILLDIRKYNDRG